MTAEEFINKNSYFILNADTPMGNTLKEVMIGFAKYHVETALTEASKIAQWERYVALDISTIKSSILNAYPLENIC